MAQLGAPNPQNLTQAEFDELSDPGNLETYDELVRIIRNYQLQGPHPATTGRSATGTSATAATAGRTPGTTTATTATSAATTWGGGATTVCTGGVGRGTGAASCPPNCLPSTSS